MQISILIELSEFIGFVYDLSDTQDGQSAREMRFTFFPCDKDSGERSRAQGPSFLTYRGYVSGL